MNKQITEDYVSYEIAKLLGEKGFDELATVFYNEDGTDLIELYDYEPLRNSEISGYARVTQSLALKWLREVHKIHITVNVGCDVDNKNYVFYAPMIVKLNDKSVEYIEPFGEDEFDSNEKAVDSALLYVLKNLI